MNVCYCENADDQKNMSNVKNGSDNNFYKTSTRPFLLKKSQSSSTDLERIEMHSSDSEDDPSRRSLELGKWILNFEDVSFP